MMESSNKQEVLDNLQSTIDKGGDEKMIAQLQRRHKVVMNDKQINKR